MKKSNIVLFFLGAILLTLGGCNNSISEDTNAIDNQPLPEVEKETYTVQGDSEQILNLYGIVQSENSKKIISNTNGIVSELNCKVGQIIEKGSVVAKINPDTNDTSYKNSIVQRTSLQQQLSNLQGIKTSTLDNFESQRKQIEVQKASTEDQLKSLKGNLANLKQQKELSSGDIDTQKASLEEQLALLMKSKELLLANKKESLEGISNTLANIKNQAYNTLFQTLNSVDLVFGFSDKNENVTKGYEKYLCAKDSQLKYSLKSDFNKISLDNYETYTVEELYVKLEQIAELTKNAAICMDRSVEGGTLTQSQINGYYSQFFSTSDGLLAIKTQIDTLLDQYTTAEIGFEAELNGLDNQIVSLKTAITSLSQTTDKNTDLTFDTNITSMESQITSMEKGLETIEQQLLSLENSKKSQIGQLDNQILSLNQSIKSINLTISGETVYTDISGTVRTRSIDIGNKIHSGDPICEIVSDNPDALKLTIYSPNKLDIGTVFSYFNDEVTGTGTIAYESPIKDQTTQNNIFESVINYEGMKEGDKLDIKVLKNIGEEEKEIWIDTKFIMPRLDGYYVNIKTGSTIGEKLIKVGEINGNKIQVLAGLEAGDVIVK